MYYAILYSSIQTMLITSFEQQNSFRLKPGQHIKQPWWHAPS